MSAQYFLTRITSFLFCIILSLFASNTYLHAQPKLDAYAIYMTPYGIDARNYNRPGFGIGGNVVYPFQETYGALAGVVGFEFVNLLDKQFDDVEYIDGVPFPYTQETSQNYARFYLGPQFGAHGKGIIRPYAGANLDFSVYWISTDIVVKDNANPNNEIRKNKSSSSHAVFGFDLMMGADIKPWENFSIDGGLKYLKSFSLPEQLGDGSLTIYPQYFQVYLGVGVSFDAFKEND